MAVSYTNMKDIFNSQQKLDATKNNSEKPMFSENLDLLVENWAGL